MNEKQAKRIRRVINNYARAIGADIVSIRTAFDRLSKTEKVQSLAQMMTLLKDMENLKNKAA